MARDVVNISLLPGNVCFGCGHENHHGLRIEITRHPSETEMLLGRFKPADYMVGFPGITHGGAIYTAMDCMAAWTPRVFRADTTAIWILRSATVKYLRPAFQGRQLTLEASIASEGRQWEPVTVSTRAFDANGNLLVQGSFKVVPLSAERFKEVAGIDELPPDWSRHLRGTTR
jgi:acyl-coenzyme A thioesterase PaaI-like protein